MPNIELYGSALCPFAQRVRLALAEKEIEAAEIEIDPANQPAGFVALSPLGKVPLLVHDGVRLWESAVINEYLDDAFPEHPLLPRSAAQRARARIWIGFADTRIYEPTHRLLMCVDPILQADIAGQLANELRFLEAHALAVHDGPYWLGAEFSLADVAFFPWFEQVSVLERFRMFRMPAECRRILAWRAAVTRRERVKRVVRPPEFYLRGYGVLADRLAQGLSAA